MADYKIEAETGILGGECAPPALYVPCVGDTVRVLEIINDQNPQVTEGDVCVVGEHSALPSYTGDCICLFLPNAPCGTFCRVEPALSVGKEI